MNILIDNRSGVPIYTQIREQVREQIMNGTLKPDDPLPSIRSLARDLRISVITTKRAYEELEKEGLVYIVAGKGCYVCEKNMELVREENLRRIEQYMEEISRLADASALAEEEILEMWKTIREEKQ